MGESIENNVARVPTHMQALSYMTGPRARKLKTVIGIGTLVWEGYRKGRNYYISHFGPTTYSIEVDKDDELYDVVSEWLLSTIPQADRTDLLAETVSTHGFEEDDEDADHVAFYFSGTETQTATVNGHTIEVALSREKEQAGAPEGTVGFSFVTERLVLTCASADALEALQEHLRRLAKDRFSVKRTSSLYMPRYDHWERREDIALRELGSVVLKTGQLESIVDDMTQFFDSREDCDRLGIPYHRAYMFHGPPGTGKTSLAKALASHFKMNIYYLPLSDVKGDGNLLGLVNGVGSNSLLLLEDIDGIEAVKERNEGDSNTGGVTISGILNMLDGPTTPNGLVVAMTTNHIERLDPALLRAGRVDRIEHIDYVQEDQLERLFQMLYGPGKYGFPHVGLEKRLAPSTVVEAFKRNRKEPEAAILSIKKKLDEHR